MQAGLRLYCSQTPEDGFSRDEAHIAFILHAFLSADFSSSEPKAQCELL